MKLLISLLLACCLTGSCAWAADVTEDSSRFRSYVKQVGCGDLLEDVDDPGVRQGVTLIVGAFISGSNFARKRVSRVDLNGMLLLTEQFCRQNPDATLLQALVNLDLQVGRASELLLRQSQQ